MEFTITIKFNPNTKDCQVTGPLKNKELCDMGLALAKGVLEQRRRRTVVPITAPMLSGKPAMPDVRELLQ
jgi:hypothetical protein